MTKQSHFWVNSVLRAVAALSETVLQHWQGTKRAMLAASWKLGHANRVGSNAVRNQGWISVQTLHLSREPLLCSSIVSYSSNWCNWENIDVKVQLRKTTTIETDIQSVHIHIIRYALVWNESFRVSIYAYVFLPWSELCPYIHQITVFLLFLSLFTTIYISTHTIDKCYIGCTVFINIYLNLIFWSEGICNLSWKAKLLVFKLNC